MTGPPRDWDKELAAIDKLIAKEPGVPAGAVPAPRASAGPVAAGREAAPVTRSRGGALATWVRVSLGVAVAAGVSLAWPYAHRCGWPLYGYLAAACGVALAGCWGAVSSWKRRMAVAHLLAVLVAVWGAVLIGKAVLDRSEYVRHPASWSCSPG